MKGFEEDKWSKKTIRDDWKVFTHIDFPFIKLEFNKIQKSFRNNGPVWKVTTRIWSPGPWYGHGYTFYGRLLKKSVPEVFEKMLKLDAVKAAIIDYLFNGKW